MKTSWFSFLACAALGGSLLASAVNAQALDKLHAGTATGLAWAFIPLNVGVQEGIFAKYGLDVDITSFGGDQKLQLGFASGAIDVGLGGGPAMVFVARGAPVITVAALVGAPRDISVVVGPNSSIKTVKDLKGKILSSAATGSLTDWLVKRLSSAEGWGPDGIKTAVLGGFQPSFAALKTHQIDGMMTATEAGYLLDERHEGRNLVGMQEYAPHFITHAIFARQKLVAEKPDLVNRFLKGIFATISFMRANKAQTSAIAEKVLHFSSDVANKTYDSEISMFVPDGRFDPKSVAVLKRSFIEMGVLKTEPRDNQLFTTRFLPVKP